MIDQSAAERKETNNSELKSKQLQRRGMFAAAWAAVAALVVAKTTQRVEAATGLQFQDTGGGGFVNNSAGGPTGLFSNSGYTSTSAAFVAYAFQGASTAGLAGVNGSGSGIAPTPCGVYGTNNKNDANTAGVVGDNSTATGIGVLGRSGLGLGALRDGTGVQGDTGGGIGVLGNVPSASNKNAIAVYGVNYSTYVGAGPGAGGFGAYGYSLRGHGLVGATGTAGGAAVVGATNGVAGAYAATFFGDVVVTGALIVRGDKNAAVPHPDGSHRLVYCVESPESWFEDFGKGQLHAGQADVSLDPDFTAIVDMDDYHVFVTSYEQHHDLMVTGRTSCGFRVHAKDEASTGPFSWRIVAKRKDIVGERLATIALPTEPQLPALPASHQETESARPMGKTPQGS